MTDGPAPEGSDGVEAGAAPGQEVHPPPSSQAEDGQPYVDVTVEEDPDIDKPIDVRLAREDVEGQSRRHNLDRLRQPSPSLTYGSRHVFSGSTVFEAHHGDINVKLAGSGSHVHPYRISHEEATLIRDTFVDSEVRQRLVKQLELQRVVVLAGEPESGRKYTAHAALLWWAYDTSSKKNRETARLVLRGDPILVKAAELQRNTGYVLNATWDEWTRHNPQEVLDHLNSLAADASCRFIVLTGPDGLAGSPSIRHEPPLAIEIFHRWLKRELPRNGVSLTAADLASLTEHVDETQSPSESAHLAIKISQALGSGERVEDVLAARPSQLRQQARKLLERSEAGEIRDPLAVRCLLISVAVLNELPVVTVSRAATRLAALMSVDLIPRHQDMPPWEWLDRMLGQVRAFCDSSPAADGSRLVRLRTPEFAPAVLEVVWKNTQISEPLLAWLKELTAAGSRDVQIRAAHAIGRLATYDFDVIYEEFFKEWTTGRAAGQGKQWLAAWALEAAVLSESASGRVLNLLTHWSTGGNAKQRTAVVRAYGSSIGVDNIEDALRAFQRVLLATSPRQIQDAVARSLTETCTPQTVLTIVAALTAWSKGEHAGLRRTAALTFIRLASEGRGQRNRLHLDELPQEMWHQVEECLTTLWWNALQEGLKKQTPAPGAPAPVSESWSVLTTWVRHWNTISPPHRAVIEEVFAGAGRCGLAEPLSFYLRHWFHSQTVNAELARRLHHLLSQNGTLS
ncbi:hypothetical protein [Sinosporangium siamense]|uniref:Uncharacterized protein n=1 Tax=Sinosporangium siamense TaxID=1367973 RepID=A0A919RIN7_9ACTN|nr:hypothetical protein [Sinosporangium siamense]GII94585.1 hypothetical protein Ssi02_48160 [Sinosporangium siamense]